MGTADPSKSEQEAGGSPKASGLFPPVLGEPLLSWPSVRCAQCSSFSVKAKGCSSAALCCLRGQHRSPTEGSRAFLLAASSARRTASFQLFLGRDTLAACVLDLSRRRRAARRRQVHHQRGSLRGPRPRMQPVGSGPGRGPWSTDSWLHILFLKPQVLNDFQNHQPFKEDGELKSCWVPRSRLKWAL